MGQIEEKASVKMGKKSSSSSSAPKSSSKKSKLKTNESLSLSDPKIQGILLVGLLAILALALWFGFTRGCMSRRRRRRRSCC